jgi:hypothetical protein
MRAEVQVRCVLSTSVDAVRAEKLAASSQVLFEATVHEVRRAAEGAGSTGKKCRIYTIFLKKHHSNGWLTIASARTK